ncbi:MAG: hypothetical protein C0444_09090 [Microbacterium sp.]|nr:hypothetical protein [Microbacterium sp.]MBA4346514.1 hypothetical protein [Microbacterium sp.]
MGGGTSGALARSMTKCSSDTFAERTGIGQGTSAVEIAQLTPPGAVVFTMPRMRRERKAGHHAHTTF